MQIPNVHHNIQNLQKIISEDGHVFSRNCYWSPDRPDFDPIGEGSIVADPQFIWPPAEDYRPGPNSDCRKIADDAGASGALTAAAPRSL